MQLSVAVTSLRARQIRVTTLEASPVNSRPDRYRPRTVIERNFSVYRRFVSPKPLTSGPVRPRWAGPRRVGTDGVGPRALTLDGPKAC